MSRSGEWRRARLAAASLYLCCDRTAGDGDLGGFLDRVLAAGVDLVQFRDKHALEDDILEYGPVFRAAALRHDALFVLNDEPLFALDLDADGVHVGQDDAPVREARRAVGPDRLVGLSTHSVAQVDAALGEACDYFATGPVWATPTKPDRPPVGLDPVRHAATVADRPWFVTGDMSPARLPEVLRAGGTRFVVVRAITGATDPAAVVRELRDLLH